VHWGHVSSSRSIAHATTQEPGFGTSRLQSCCLLRASTGLQLRSSRPFRYGMHGGIHAVLSCGGSASAVRLAWYLFGPVVCGMHSHHASATAVAVLLATRGGYGAALGSCLQWETCSPGWHVVTRAAGRRVSAARPGLLCHGSSPWLLLAHPPVSPLRTWRRPGATLPCRASRTSG
jgi:hypothetical protein